jgi:hypothetical protein
MLLANDPTHLRWTETAAALGLGTFLPIGAFDLRATFKTSKRALGTASPRPSVWAWMFGKRGKGEVLVATQVREPDAQMMTSAVARIDPPLFLGIEAWRQPHGTFEGRAWAPDRMAQLFARAPTALTALANVPGAVTAVITDSTVILNFPRIATDARELGYALDTAVNAAASLAEARRGLPKSEGERTQEATWQAFASENSLSFDPDRLELSGVVAAAKVRIALEGEPFCAMTTVNAEFPGRLNLGLHITRQRMPGFVGQLMGIMDLLTGDPYFDEAFIVRGNPANAVQQMLWQNSRLRHTILELGLASRAFEIGDGHLFAQYVTPMATTAELRGLCDRIGALVGDLFPGVSQPAGPYR